MTWLQIKSVELSEVQLQVYQYDNWGHGGEDLDYSLPDFGITYSDRLERGAYLSQFKPHDKESMVPPKRR
jgi:hypothetical protein